MKPIKIDLSENFKEIEIMPVADYHWADPHSDHDAIRRDIDYVNSHDNGFARPSAANSSITYCTKLFVNCAAKLQYGGYGDTGGFKPPCIETPRILLSGETKDMRAVI